MHQSNRLFKRYNRFHATGTSLVEYAVLLGLVVVGLMGVIFGTDMYDRIRSWVMVTLVGEQTGGSGTVTVRPFGS